VSLVDQIRTALEGIVEKYQDTNTTTCTNWTLPHILAATGNSTSNWTPIVSNLLKPKHFTELKAVTDLLTTEISCCGACCLTNGTCAQLSPCACTSQSGIYHGDGTVCSNYCCVCPSSGPMPSQIKLTHSVTPCLGCFPPASTGNPYDVLNADLTVPSVVYLSRVSDCSYQSGPVGHYLDYHYAGESGCSGTIGLTTEDQFIWSVNFGINSTSIICYHMGGGWSWNPFFIYIENLAPSPCYPNSYTNQVTTCMTGDESFPIGTGGTVTIEAVP